MYERGEAEDLFDNSYDGDSNTNGAIDIGDDPTFWEHFDVSAGLSATEIQNSIIDYCLSDFGSFPIPQAWRNVEYTNDLQLTGSEEWQDGLLGSADYDGTFDDPSELMSELSNVVYSGGLCISGTFASAEDDGVGLVTDRVVVETYDAQGNITKVVFSGYDDTGSTVEEVTTIDYAYTSDSYGRITKIDLDYSYVDNMDASNNYSSSDVINVSYMDD